MDWGWNLIRFRTANFLLIILQISPIWSCQDNLLSIVEPRHLDEDLSSMVLVTYIKAGGGPIKFDLDIIIASVFDSWAISLLAVHHVCSWKKFLKWRDDHVCILTNGKNRGVVSEHIEITTRYRFGQIINIYWEQSRSQNGPLWYSILHRLKVRFLSRNLNKLVPVRQVVCKPREERTRYSSGLQFL